MTEPKWVLVTEGGSGESRAAVAAVRALDAVGYRAAVTETLGFSLAGSSQSCSRRVPTPPVDDDPAGYARAVAEELAQRPYLGVLPASDSALLALGEPVGHLLDKANSAELARDAGIATPPAQSFASAAELRSAVASLPFPVVVKPTVKRFSAVRLGSAADIDVLGDREGPFLVQPWLEDGLHGVVGLVWQGELVSGVHLRYERVWPRPCGTISAAETVAPDAELEAALVRLLRGYNGLFHVDMAGPYLLDVNPRIHASLPAAQAAGAPLIASWCAAKEGRAVTRSRGRAGVRFRFVEGDIRSVAWAVRHGALSRKDAAKALLPRRGTVHSYATLHDPGPSVARMRYARRRLLRARGEPATVRPT